MRPCDEKRGRDRRCLPRFAGSGRGMCSGREGWAWVFVGLQGDTRCARHGHPEGMGLWVLLGTGVEVSRRRGGSRAAGSRGGFQGADGRDSMFMLRPGSRDVPCLGISSSPRQPSSWNRSRDTSSAHWQPSLTPNAARPPRPSLHQGKTAPSVDGPTPPLPQEKADIRRSPTAPETTRDASPQKMHRDQGPERGKTVGPDASGNNAPILRHVPRPNGKIGLRRGNLFGLPKADISLPRNQIV